MNVGFVGKSDFVQLNAYGTRSPGETGVADSEENVRYGTLLCLVT